MLMLGQPAPVTSAIVGLVAALGISAATDAVAPKPIDVHDLHMEPTCQWAGREWAGCIAQDRTVTPAGNAEAHSALWFAEIIQAETGNPVPWCIGSGGADYRAGRNTVVIPLPLWTGAADCTLASLPPGTYQPRAVWRWGTEEETHTGHSFEVTP